MRKPKIGLLPLYIKLYDDSSPSYRPHVEAFYAKIADALSLRGLEVLRVPVCRIKSEFAAAVKSFEDAGADAVVTLHLAYSPSLESAEVLAGTKLPLIVLDTTPDYEFDPGIDSAKISYNHGIHGVMDMCNLLCRNGKKFEIFAGHWEKSRVLDRVTIAVYGAVMAADIRRAKVGTFGKPFDGMGDFAVPYDTIKKTIGAEAFTIDPEQLEPVAEERVRAEYENDCRLRDMNGVSYEQYKGCESVALSIRDYIEKVGLTAFSMNFLATKAGTKFDYIPFTEACKALERGVGYAGEGDVLTAAFVGALLSVYPETSFCEMFCPDWQGESIYLSHMGEYNPRCTKGVGVYDITDFPYTDAGNPTVFHAPFKAGRAVFCCLAPAFGGGYRLIYTDGSMLPVPKGTSFDKEVSGWFKPRMSISDFFTEYCKNGGIHHAALIYGADLGALRSFADFMGWEIVEI